MSDALKVLKIAADEKTAVFFDGTHHYAALRAIKEETGVEFKFDFILLTNFFNQYCMFRQANYYTPAIRNESINKLIEFLMHNGYYVFQKDGPQSFRSELDPGEIKNAQRDNSPASYEEDRQHQGFNSLVPEIMGDMYDILPYIDHAVLFSGNEAYSRVAESYRKQAKKFTVVSTKIGGIISRNLIKSATGWVEMNDKDFRKEFSMGGTYSPKKADPLKKVEVIRK
jgi:uncharacterized LabA/DUF88 family protein